MPGSTRAFAISNELRILELRASEGRRGLWRIFRTGAGRVGSAITGGLLAVALLAGQIAPADPFASVGSPLTAPTLAHPMGTDDLGRDVLSGVVYGTRTSLLLAILVSLLSGALGIAIGSMAAWQGRRVDDVLMRCTEFVQIVPRFFLAVIVVAVFGPGLDRLVLLLGLTSWPWIARWPGPKCYR